MKILIVGDQSQYEEIRRKFGAGYSYTRADEREPVPDGIEFVFDFHNTDSADLSMYQSYSSVLFINSVFTTLSAFKVSGLSCTVFGFCGLPTFVERGLLEVTVIGKQSLERLSSACARLKTDYRVVADKVGMVTPRVICMIINEAYYTAEEGTASREDIDMAMKLGTNYPFGPFEWSERIGREVVKKLLGALRSSTGDVRYELCRSL
jgi:3-hydroxybutyryl-CoA dehydrogenase